MLMKCCWNDEHDSTMTEDRANPQGGRELEEGTQSLAWWGIQRIAAVWKEGLKVTGNGPVGEFCRRAKVAKGATGSRRIERGKGGQIGEKKPRTRRGFFIGLVANTGV
ncbi:hypothetical protein [Paraburkholderia sediminicola]|uniref:hypothetical protein n=1 Tax=Paraburkholderia sediminicola TaxID=458836 RepID=UPI0038BB1EF1